jgi:hypothetical protein
MEQVSKLLDELPEDSHALTLRLLHAIHSCHKTPRLRKRLAEIPAMRFQAHLPGSNGRDVTYLLAGLMAISSFEVNPFPPTSFVQELGEYLRAGARVGISISQFLTGSLTRWEEIRPKHQELIRTQASGGLQSLFPNLNEDSSLRIAHYLLSNDLARMVPAFPFHKPHFGAPVMIVRPQTDLAWTPVSDPRDTFDTLYNHFPEIEWRSGNVIAHKIWLVGVRVLSPLSVETSLVLRKALSKLAYQASTRVKDKEKFLSLIFLCEADANLFQFNLRHYAKFSSIHHQFVPTTLSDYRKGYPGWSGFFEPDVIREAGLKV